MNNRDKNSAHARWKGGSVYSRHQEPVKVFKSSSQNSSGLSNKVISNQNQNAKRYNFQYKALNNSSLRAGLGSKLQDESNSSGGENSAFKSRFNNFTIQNSNLKGAQFSGPNDGLFEKSSGLPSMTKLD